MRTPELTRVTVSLVINVGVWVVEFGGLDCEDDMLIAVWDWLFTRRIWTETERLDVFTNRRGVNYKTGLWIILKDQFGNVKIKKVR